jgi:two-component system response regulator HydG
MPLTTHVERVASPAEPVLLVVDDEPGVVAMIERFARERGFQVIAHTNGREALAHLPVLRSDVALVDLRLPDVGGLEILSAMRDADDACQVILMTGRATVDSAIQAVKLGAVDYLSKPFDLGRLDSVLGSVRRGLEHRRQLLAADIELATRFEFCGLVGRSPVMQELFDAIRRLAPHVRTAVVTGEAGTGKTLVAHALHSMGPRGTGRFVSVRCSAASEALLASDCGESLGRGVDESTDSLIEHADGGTLFLDGVAELPLSAQTTLLKAVEREAHRELGDLHQVEQERLADRRRFGVHVIAATSRDLRDEVAAGRFRRDLYHRLNVVEIALPPLRDRREDIPYLTAAFLRGLAEQFGRPTLGLSAGAERMLHDAPWPGNVRELRNVLERAVESSAGRLLTERELQIALGGSPSLPDDEDHAFDGAVSPFGSSLPPRSDHDRAHLAQVLREVGGNRSAAARALGISRRALYRRLDTFGLR